VFAHIVVTNFHEGLTEDLESKLRFGGVWALILLVNLASNSLGEDSLSVDEVTVFDIEVNVSQS